ncbi:cupin domain-containing protein [candidate division KSB1 bacterium]|nr:cupin domain-containing protein [candidate division KSB1 bacterium]
MSIIIVDSAPDQTKLDSLGVFNWPIWTKEVSEFPWFYGEQETCYFLEGAVEVKPSDGEPVRMGKGDLVILPKSMSCTWRIVEDVRKHYHFG